MTTAAPNRRRAAEWMAARLKEIGAQGLTDAVIDLGNGAFKRGGKPFWVSVRVGYGERLESAERIERRKAEIRVEFYFTKGTGAARGDNLASRAAGILVPGDSEKGGFMADGVRYYALGVRQETMKEEAEWARFSVVFEMVCVTEGD